MSMPDINLLTAPAYALFSRDFYRRVQLAPLSRGFLYMALLAGVSTLLFIGMVQVRLMPEVEKSVEWVKQEFPRLIVTKDGIQMNGTTTKTMIHPEWGTVAIFDMSVTELPADQELKVPIYVTAKKVYVRQRPGQVRIYDVTEAARSNQQVRQPMEVTGPFLEEMYKRFMPWILVLTYLLYAAFYYVAVVIGALLYSLIGRLINARRQVKLSYASVLNVTIFAMTAHAILEFLTLVSPIFAFIPTGFLMGLLLTSGYLYFGLLKTEEPHAI